MINILITGANGQLGSELQDIVKCSEAVSDFKLFPTDIPLMDITDAESVDKFIADNKIDVIVNCAAYTNVDKAETDAQIADKINHVGVGVLAQAAAKNNITLVHVSTDYVFDGTAHLPYQESDQTSPIGVYGRTKLSGEDAVVESGCKSVIIRTSWLYSAYGNNFVKTMRRLGGERESLGVIFDQVGTPTYARDLADAIYSIIPQIIEKPQYGERYHFSNEGVCSWYDFSTRIMALSGIECDVRPIETADYPTLATRPNYSVLNKKKIKREFGIEIPHWEMSLVKCLKRL